MSNSDNKPPSNPRIINRNKMFSGNFVRLPNNFVKPLGNKPSTDSDPSFSKSEHAVEHAVEHVVEKEISPVKVPLTDFSSQDIQSNLEKKSELIPVKQTIKVNPTPNFNPIRKKINFGQPVLSNISNQTQLQNNKPSTENLSDKLFNNKSNENIVQNQNIILPTNKETLNNSSVPKPSNIRPTSLQPKFINGVDLRLIARKEVLTLPTVEIEPISTDEQHNFERVNGVQVKYQAMSVVNPTGAVIPESMALETKLALESLCERVGNIDEWVKTRLQWNTQQLGFYLTSEQVDAVALALDAADRGEGLIVADQTGFGKGRVLAATARAIVLSGNPVIFMTEKANLFSDFWRDIRDISSEDVFGNPFMLNDGAKIVDTSSEEARVLIPAAKKAEVARIIKSGRLPPGCNLMMTTYSQFNRKGTRKTAFLDQVSGGAHIILDESHNFVGKSTTSKMIGEALEKASGSTFSSATFGRGVENLVAYSSVFPWLKKLGSLEEMTPAQRRALAEESVQLATRAGRIIRREHDLSNMVLSVREDNSRKERNEDLADKLAPILSIMARLARKVDLLLEDKNEQNKAQLEVLVSAEQKKSEREVWVTANFGTRLNAIIGQFLVALEVDACVEECISSLLAGEKPVVVIETTMESLMRELIKDSEATSILESEGGETETLPTADDNNEDDEPDDNTRKISNLEKPPSFKDALLIMADRLLKVNVRRGVEFEKEQVVLDVKEFVEMQQKIIELAKDFPDLSLSPIDDIRDQVEAKGKELFAKNKISKAWVADEISARSMRVVSNQYVSMPAQDRNRSVARFVNGGSQCLVITRAASTGLSIHDSDKFTDHARRHMIELRAPANVVERIQTWGRVFRRGQRTEPRFSTLSTGLPFQVYNLAMQNRKVENLCASVTGSGKTTASMDVLDPIDATGNDVAYEFLMEHQNLAEHMGIPMNVDREEADKEFYFVSKLLRRLPLLRIDNQRKVFASFMAAYEDRLKSDVAVTSGRTLDGVWESIKREIFEAGDGSADPVNGKDVWITTVKSYKNSQPMRSDLAKEMIVNSLARLGDKPFVPYLQAIRQQRSAILEGALHKKKFGSVQAALKSNEDNSVKRAETKLSYMSALLERLTPGAAALLPNEDGEPTPAIILDVRVPMLDRATMPREYEIVFAFPGDSSVRTISLDAMVRDGSLQLMGTESGRSVLNAMDTSLAGNIEVQRKVIDGNGIGAILASKRMGVGTRTSYVDPNGRLKNAILLPRAIERRLASQTGKTVIADVAASLVIKGGRVWTNSVSAGMGIEITPSKNGQTVSITVPFTKRDSKSWETPELVSITGEFKGDWARGREAIIPMNKLTSVFKQLKKQNCDFFFDPEYRKFVVEKSKQISYVNNQNIEQDFDNIPRM